MMGNNNNEVEEDYSNEEMENRMMEPISGESWETEEEN